MTAHADEHRVMVRSILKEAMAILRDDKPFDPLRIIFGRIIDTEPHYRLEGRRYLYASQVSPSSTVIFTTFDDPDDYSADRSKVKIVPGSVTIRLDPMIPGLPDAEIKTLLQLEDFWVDPDGNHEYGNEIMTRTPYAPNEQSFRYRSKNIPGSKFPVNVNIAYANPLDESFPQMLSEVSIKRAYAILTPEEREQRRLEEQQAKRRKYGLMNLCTGMLCPETGIWQGYTKTSDSDIHLIRRGQKFPDVRKLTPREQAERGQYTNLFEAGQWMWVEEYQDRS
ncbi:hypothetical protein [Burkholderia anthina]|uniref:hypothetical protein n=1 Tax=Burkholderia anthina TaxID=179879 RepID=UPI001588F298